MALGEKIKKARDEAGMTQDDLAYTLRAYPTLERVTSSLISGWENGEVKRVSFPAVDAIAHATGKPLEFFSEQTADADASANPPASNDPDDADRDDEKASVAEAAGRRHPTKGAASRRRSRD